MNQQASEERTQLLENHRKAFDLANSLATLLSTLSTGTVVISGVFLSDVLGTSDGLHVRALLYVSWALLGVAAMSGPIFIGALVWELQQRRAARLTIQAASIRLSASLQILSFVPGMLLFALFVAINL